MKCRRFNVALSQCSAFPEYNNCKQISIWTTSQIMNLVCVSVVSCEQSYPLLCSHSELRDPQGVRRCPLLVLLWPAWGQGWAERGQGAPAGRQGPQWDLETGLWDASVGEMLSPDWAPAMCPSHTASTAPPQGPLKELWDQKQHTEWAFLFDLLLCC